jgi:GNAT superfamily N-acetyltransferase
MEKPDVSIRRATADDNLLLARLGARTFYDTFACDNTAEDMAAYLADSFSPRKQAEELADPLTVFLIAEIDEEAAGYAKLQAAEPSDCITGPSPIELVRLYALKDWIGHGIGATLMQACLDEAGRRGYQTMWLGVWERNLRAQAFYRKWGFVEVGTHIFQLGDDRQTDILMQRQIAPHSPLAERSSY